MEKILVTKDQLDSLEELASAYMVAAENAEGLSGEDVKSVTDKLDAMWYSMFEVNGN